MDELKGEVRENIFELTGKIFEKFDKVSSSRVRSDGETDFSPTMCTGTAGIGYALYRYVLLLRKENKIHTKYTEQLKEAEALLYDVIAKNIEMTAKLMNPGDAITCSGFLMSEAIGTATLQIINSLSINESDGSEIDFAEVYDIITYILLPSLRKVMKPRAE